MNSFAATSRLPSNQKNDMIPTVFVASSGKLWVKAIVSNIGVGRGCFIGHKVGIIHGSDVIKHRQWKDTGRDNSECKDIFCQMRVILKGFGALWRKNPDPFRLPEPWIKNRDAIKRDYFFVNTQPFLCGWYLLWCYVFRVSLKLSSNILSPHKGKSLCEIVSNSF